MTPRVRPNLVPALVPGRGGHGRGGRRGRFTARRRFLRVGAVRQAIILAVVDERRLRVVAWREWQYTRGYQGTDLLLHAMSTPPAWFSRHELGFGPGEDVNIRETMERLLRGGRSRRPRATPLAMKVFAAQVARETEREMRN